MALNFLSDNLLLDFDYSALLHLHFVHALHTHDDESALGALFEVFFRSLNSFGVAEVTAARVPQACDGCVVFACVQAMDGVECFA